MSVIIKMGAEQKATLDIMYGDNVPIEVEGVGPDIGKVFH